MASSASSTGVEPKVSNFYSTQYSATTNYSYSTGTPIGSRKSVEEVKAENSLENKVDQLWQSILIPLFPFDEGYLVVARDRVVNDNKKSADLIVKWLQDDRVVIVFTMSNKRASAKKPMRDEALGQLGDYMELAHTNRTEQGGLPHGSEL
jgi:hypothetical protein